MSFSIDSIVYGPFQAQYHRATVNDSFKRLLCEFLTAKLLPQLDRHFTEVHGALTACFDDERHCGPNSLVRDCYRLEVVFRGPDGESQIKAEITYNSERGFAARRGDSFYLWTPSRRRKRQAEQEAIRKTIAAVLEKVVERAACPICHAELQVVNTPNLFDVVCPSRCFKYNFHRDENGQPSHGHFFMSDPSSDVSAPGLGEVS